MQNHSTLLLLRFGIAIESRSCAPLQISPDLIADSKSSLPATLMSPGPLFFECALLMSASLADVSDDVSTLLAGGLL